MLALFHWHLSGRLFFDIGRKFGVPIWDPWEYLLIATNDIPCIKQNYETPKIPLLMVRMLETLDGFLLPPRDMN